MCGGSRLAPVDNNISPTWPGSDYSPDLKFHKNLTELQKIKASSGPDTSSRRLGFRLSNASSYDFGVEDGIDLSDSMSLENIHSLSSTDQKCGLCRRLLCQKSPCSSCRVIRNGDMPIAGVLPCGHAFHADCLEEMTPKTQIHDPPCPACAGVVGCESISFSEPLQVALRAERKKQGNLVILESAPIKSHLVIDNDPNKNHSHPILRLGSTSLIKNHFKKHFSFKGSIGKDFFDSKLLRRRGSASSSSMLRTSKKCISCSKTGKSKV